MKVQRYPVFVWRDHAGGYTAVMIDDPHVSSVSNIGDVCVSQIKQYLQWIQRHQAWRLPRATPGEWAMTVFGVEVRPEYVRENRRYPSDKAFKLKVHCAHMQDANGLWHAALPLLRLRFSFFDREALKDLVQHYVRDTLRGLPPAAIARYLAPKSAALDEITLVGTPPPAKPVAPSYPALESVAEPLGKQTLRRQFARAYERDAEIQALHQSLDIDRSCVLIVGEPGIGKTTLLANAVREAERRDRERARELEAQGKVVPPRAPRYWLTSAARLIAGMMYLGEWEQRLEQVIREINQAGGVLCVENLLDLVRIGGRGAGDSLAAFLLPYVRNRELRLCGEASHSELNALRRLMPALADAMRILELRPFSRATSVRVLEHMGEAARKNLDLRVEPRVYPLVERLFRRFMPYSAFPGKAADFFANLTETTAAEGGREVGVDETILRFVETTGLPEVFLRDELPLKAADVAAHFKTRVIGQDGACELAANLVATFKAGLNDPQRPVGVLLFCGPTGVGKTELARTLAKYLFGKGEGERLIRLDMSEYAGFGAADRLLNGPDDDASDFIRRVREQPFSVILFDEIEKASPDVFDALMGVFDEGRLTDRFGRLTHFQSSFIVMTSNLGVGAEASLGFGDTRPPDYDAEAMKFFRPEFFNRMDALVVFHALGAADVKRIARKELDEINLREGLIRAGLKLTFSEAVVEYAAQAGFDKRYGARPLQRAIEQIVVTPLSRYLVERPGLRGATLHIDLDADGKPVIV